jgi:hypothetical protein
MDFTNQTVGYPWSAGSRVAPLDSQRLVWIYEVPHMIPNPCNLKLSIGDNPETDVKALAAASCA